MRESQVIMNTMQLEQEGDVRKLKRLAWGVIALLGLMTVGIIGVGGTTFNRFQDIDKSWRQFHEDPELKGFYLNQVRGYFGYGGFIHLFKNYVLRQDEALLPGIRENLEELRTALNKYEAVGVGTIERAAIVDIRTVIEEYATKLEVAENAVAKGLFAQDIDKFVKVDDSPAFSAFATLEQVWMERRKAGATRQAQAINSGTMASRTGLVILPLFIAVVLVLILFLIKLVKQIDDHTILLRKLSRSVEQNPNMILITDVEGVIQYVNPAFTKRTGYHSDEAVGQNPRILKSGEMPSEMYEDLWGTILSGNVWRHEITDRRKDGSKLWSSLTIAPVTDDSGTVTHFVAMHDDITQQRKVEQDLRESEQRFKHFAESASDWLWETDEELRFTRTLGAARKVTGLIKRDFIGKTRDEVVQIKDPSDHWPQHLEDLQARRQFRDFSYWITNSAGERRCLNVSGSPCFDEQGNFKGYRGVGSDITERKKAENELQARRSELAHIARVSTMGEMATSLAHELNQPLSAISLYAQGYLDLLGAGKLNREELQRDLEKIVNEAHRSSDIIKRIRQFVRKEPSERKKVDVNALVRDVSDLIALDAKGRNVVVTYNLEKDLPIVIADPIQIEQVILNLAHNGIEAMDGCDVLSRRLSISTEIKGRDTIKVNVCDTGPGLSEEVRKKMFDSFFTTKPTGMGMGLAISHSIIESHGGVIVAAVNGASGAAISFTLSVDEQGGR